MRTKLCTSMAAIMIVFCSMIVFFAGCNEQNMCVVGTCYVEGVNQGGCNVDQYLTLYVAKNKVTESEYEIKKNDFKLMCTSSPGSARYVWYDEYYVAPEGSAVLGTCSGESAGEWWYESNTFVVNNPDDEKACPPEQFTAREEQFKNECSMDLGAGFTGKWLSGVSVDPTVAQMKTCGQ